MIHFIIIQRSINSETHSVIPLMSLDIILVII